MKTNEIWIEKSTGQKFVIIGIDSISFVPFGEFIYFCELNCKGHGGSVFSCRGDFRDTFIKSYKKEY